MKRIDGPSLCVFSGRKAARELGSGSLIRASECQFLGSFCGLVLFFGPFPHTHCKFRSVVFALIFINIDLLLNNLHSGYVAIRAGISRALFAKSWLLSSWGLNTALFVCWNVY